MEKVRSALRRIPANSITYGEYVQMCIEVSLNRDQGVDAKMLYVSGNVIVCGNVVFLRPEQSYNSQPSKESNDHRMERARTTVEEFERVSEELEKVAEAKARQGFAIQTIGKAHDGTREAAVGDSGSESVNEKYKEEPVARRGTSTRRATTRTVKLEGSFGSD